ncbi:MAG: HAD family hydrolase [Phycisphaerae bacterium]|nr:HAD family hydrolase [Phycisphaerae bacterium]
MAPNGPSACIFDLDGTLVDSLQDIAESLNECLALLGLPPRPVEDYRYLVGEGIPTLAQRLLGDTNPLLAARLTELARARYRTRPLLHTRPYREVDALVQQLRAAGLRLAVLSNKPHELTVRVVRAFWPDSFDAIQGYVEEDLRKPNPLYALRLCERMQVQPQQVWFIGDTPTDVETAHRAGAVSIGVTWGFRTRADLEAAGADRVSDEPLEIARQALSR